MHYEDLLAAVQQQPEGADYHALRMAYICSPQYAPYIQASDALEALRAALHTGDWHAALDAIDQLLDHNYLDIEAHMAADYVFLRLDQEKDALYHRTFASGLLDAILATGNGRSPETAWIVIAVQEEYTVLRVLGLTPSGQRLIQHDGQFLDVLDAEHNTSGQMLQLYFNVDLPRDWLGRQMDAADDA
ncbi:MAG: DUF4919 domain-containing protein [Chloroflexi bacterium]|nr:DUF4919 domain-containing protein [Chloroflexota bacterium]